MTPRDVASHVIISTDRRHRNSSSRPSTLHPHTYTSCHVASRMSSQKLLISTLHTPPIHTHTRHVMPRHMSSQKLLTSTLHTPPIHTHTHTSRHVTPRVVSSQKLLSSRPSSTLHTPPPPHSSHWPGRATALHPHIHITPCHVTCRHIHSHLVGPRPRARDRGAPPGIER